MGAGGWSQPAQRGFTPAGRHDKSGLWTMDESSILRRRGLQVGEPMQLGARVCVDECVCAAPEICVGWSCGVTLYCVPALLVRLLHCSSDTRRDFETFLVGTLAL